MNKLATKLNLLNTISSDSPHKKYKMIVAKADSAATHNYWRNEDMDCLSRIRDYNGPSVTLPNNTRISPKKQGLIPLPKEFSENARTATNLPHLKSSSLLATGPLCDDGKVVLFDREKVHVIQH